MKFYLSSVLLLLLGVANAFSQEGTSIKTWPDSIFSGKQGAFHVQSVAVDKAHRVIYFSFTDRLIKTDLSGKLIGSVTGFAGHLGDLDFNESDGKIYGSLEYKDDAIGKGIKKQLGIKNEEGETGFYIAIFDGSQITRPDMNAEKEDLVKTVYMADVVKDYNAEVHNGTKTDPHRFACSGIDGLAFAPPVGEPKSAKQYLYLAYGVYGDTTRTDNDYQIVTRYDVTGWSKFAKKLTQDNLHHSGPEKPLDKYFIKTGATNYGIQNLAYDAHTGNLFAAVYKGSKPQFPNYDLFVIDMHQQPSKTTLTCDNQQMTVKTLPLMAGTGGWHFPWGSTGLCPLTDGYFYISHNLKTKDGKQQSTIYKYKWVGDAKESFVQVK